MSYRFSILGPTALHVGDKLVSDWQYPKQRAVLAVLLLHPGQTVSFEAITRWVWPMGEQPTNQDTFQRYAQHIKKGLRLLDPTPDLHNHRGTLRLDVARHEVDYWWLRATVERGADLLRSSEHHQAHELLSQAVHLWTSHPFADLQGQPAEHRRWQAESDLWAPAYDLLLLSLDRLGKSQEMLHRLDDLPFDHRGHYRLAVHRIKALYAVGRQRDAMIYLQEARRQLLANDEIDAANELVKQHDLIRQHADAATSIVVNGHDSGAVERLSPDMLPQDVEFVGRADLLTTLHTHTMPSGEPGRGVVIIDGPPGIGKTALVNHWAHQVRHQFSGGVLFANLGGYSDRTVVDPALVVDEFLLALGAAPDDTMSPRARELLLNRLLAERPTTLVVLDNIRDNEHVRDLVPRLASGMVVITSRRRLAALGTTVGARRITVGPMTATEADHLLSVQLGTRRELNREDRASLVARCGGLPVAISVATAYLATCPTAPITAFAEQISPRELIVDLGDHDGAVNVGALFAQSYDSLAEPERRLFRLLGLHPGPDISLATAIACDGRSRKDTSRSLAKLVDAHLLEQPELGRYRAHDLLTEFAVLCAEADEPVPRRRAAEERVVCSYLAAAIHAAQVVYPTYIPPPETDGLGAETQNVNDISQAKEWFHRERVNLLSIIAYSAETVPTYTYQIVDPVALFCDRLGLYLDSRRIQELAVSAAVATGNRENQASALSGLARVQVKLGDHHAARHNLDAALRIVEQDGHERGQAAILLQIGNFKVGRGDYGEALHTLHRGLAITRRRDDLEGMCWFHRSIAEVLRLTHQYADALGYLDQVRPAAEAIDDKSVEASLLSEVGSVVHAMGDHASARDQTRRAIQLAEAVPDLAVAARAYTVLAEINCADARYDVAVHNAQRAIAICDQSHNVEDKARAVDVLGAIHHASGERHDAAQAWRQAVALHRGTGNTIRADLLQARLETIQGHPGHVPSTRRTGSPRENQQV